MSPLARRGRIIFLFMAVVLVALQIANFALALLRTTDADRSSLAWWKTLLVPLIFIGIIVWLYNGDKTARWLFVVWSLLKGTGPLIAATGIGVLMWQATPPGGTAFFLRFFSLALGPLVVLGACWMTIAASAIWMPSLQAFFEHQRGEFITDFGNEI